MKIGYARVSTQDQNLDTQIEALTRSNCDVIYQEKVGSMKDRPELEKLLKSLNKGDVLIVYKLDRLGRSLSHLVKILDILQAKKVDFISLQDNFDTTTTQGKMLLGITIVFAEFERNLISDRTKAALQHLKSQGIRLGRPLWMSDESKARAKQAKKLRKLHYTVKFICDELNISRRTCYKYLNM